MTTFKFTLLLTSTVGTLIYKRRFCALPVRSRFGTFIYCRRPSVGTTRKEPAMAVLGPRTFFIRVHHRFANLRGGYRRTQRVAWDEDVIKKKSKSMSPKAVFWDVYKYNLPIHKSAAYTISHVDSDSMSPMAISMITHRLDGSSSGGAGLLTRNGSLTFYPRFHTQVLHFPCHFQRET